MADETAATVSDGAISSYITNTRFWIRDDSSKRSLRGLKLWHELVRSSTTRNAVVHAASCGIGRGWEAPPGRSSLCPRLIPPKCAPVHLNDLLGKWPAQTGANLRLGVR